MAFTVLNSAGVTCALIATTIGNATTFLTQSLPTGTTGNPLFGSANSANSMPVVIASDQGAVAFNLTQVAATAITLGQKVSATSFPVVIASDQSNLSTIIVAALPAGSNAIGTVSVANTVTVSGGTTSANITQVGGAALALGSTTAASSIPVVLATNQTAVPVSGTVSVSGLVATPATLTSVVSTSGAPAAVAVKNASGTIYAIGLSSNNSTAATFLKIFNVTAAGVSSSVVPFITIAVPPGAVNNWPINSNGVAMGGTGISYLITRNATANDTTAVNAYDVVGALGYI